MGEKNQPQTFTDMLTFAEATNAPVQATFQGVTVSILNAQPLTASYRFKDSSGREMSYVCAVSKLDSSSALRRRADEILDEATSGIFPPSVSELLLEHAVHVSEVAKRIDGRR